MKASSVSRVLANICFRKMRYHRDKKKKNGWMERVWFVPVCISKAKIWTNMWGNHQWAIINTQAVTSAPLPRCKNVVLRALWIGGVGGCKSAVRRGRRNIFFYYYRALRAGKDSKPKENKQDDTLFPYKRRADSPPSWFIKLHHYTLQIVSLKRDNKSIMF